MYSFKKRKVMVDATQQIRHLIDITTPNLPSVTCGRMSRRYNRTVEGIVAPWNNGQPNLDKIGIGITSDFCDNGISILTSYKMDEEVSTDWVVGFWLRDLDMEEPWYFHCQVRSRSGQLGDLNKYGLEVVEFLNSEHRLQTQKLDNIFLQWYSPEPAQA